MCLLQLLDKACASPKILLDEKNIDSVESTLMALNNNDGLMKWRSACDLVDDDCML